MRPKDGVGYQQSLSMQTLSRKLVTTALLASSLDKLRAATKIFSIIIFLGVSSFGHVFMRFVGSEGDCSTCGLRRRQGLVIIQWPSSAAVGPFFPVRLLGCCVFGDSDVQALGHKSVVARLASRRPRDNVV
jgi:hypothetical protein